MAGEPRAVSGSWEVSVLAACLECSLRAHPGVCVAKFCSRALESAFYILLYP